MRVRAGEAASAEGSEARGSTSSNKLEEGGTGDAWGERGGAVQVSELPSSYHRVGLLAGDAGVLNLYG